MLAAVGAISGRRTRNTAARIIGVSGAAQALLVELQLPAQAAGFTRRPGDSLEVAQLLVAPQKVAYCAASLERPVEFRQQAAGFHGAFEPGFPGHGQSLKHGGVRLAEGSRREYGAARAAV
jgi:hypothetical protein